MKSPKKFALFIVFALGVFTAPACGLFSRSEYSKLTPEDLTALVGAAFPDAKQRNYAENQGMRKGLIDESKRQFALAQAAQAEGLEKTDKFKWQMGSITDQLLASKYIERNTSDEERRASLTANQSEFEKYLDKQIEKRLKMANQPSGPELIKQIKDGMSNEELKGMKGQWENSMIYRFGADKVRQIGLAADQKEYEGYVAFLNQTRKPPLTPEEIEERKGEWMDVKLCANKARQDGLDKDPKVTILLKFYRAELLAKLYDQMQNERFMPKPEEYYKAHPEADPEKIKENVRKKAEELLERIKKGENFEEIAKQFTEDKVERKEKGGELGWFGKGVQPPEIEEAVFALQPGQISGVVESRYGFHIFKVDARRKVGKKAAPPKPGASPAGANAEPQEEVMARHIFLDTQKPDERLDKLIETAQSNIQSAKDKAVEKYPVSAQFDDFTVKVGGYEGRMTGPGGGVSGRMRGINPQEDK